MCPHRVSACPRQVSVPIVLNCLGRCLPFAVIEVVFPGHEYDLRTAIVLTYACRDPAAYRAASAFSALDASPVRLPFA